MTEKEKMLSGKIYDPADPELTELRTRAHLLSQQFNSLPETDERRREILSRLLGGGESAYLVGPVWFDYGCFTTMGANASANFNFTCLDCAPVTIGENVLMGPNVSLLTPVHPLCRQDRDPYRRADGTVTDREYARPIRIGPSCWLGGNVTVCGGVTIGEGAVIGAGSVVTRDIPAHVFAAGVPCRVIREITDRDALSNHPELF